MLINTSLGLFLFPLLGDSTLSVCYLVDPILQSDDRIFQFDEVLSNEGSFSWWLNPTTAGQEL